MPRRRCYTALAAELAALPVDAMMTWGTPALLAAKRATTTIPIVMGTIGDPVEVGAVANLSRPGGNVTGFSTQNYELEAKRLELLRELLPGMTLIGLLGNADNPYVIAALKQVQQLAERGGLKPDVVAIETSEGLERGLVRLAQSRRSLPGRPCFLTARTLSSSWRNAGCRRSIRFANSPRLAG